MSQTHPPCKEGEPETPSSPAVLERRLSVRYTIGRDAVCSNPMEWSKKSWSAWLHDLSETGVGVVLFRRFEPETLLWIEVPGTSEIASRSLLARVVHVHPYRNKGWFVGCTLMIPLGEDELHEIKRTAAFPQESPSEAPDQVAAQLAVRRRRRPG